LLDGGAGAACPDGDRHADARDGDAGGAELAARDERLVR